MVALAVSHDGSHIVWEGERVFLVRFLCQSELVGTEWSGLVIGCEHQREKHLRRSIDVDPGQAVLVIEALATQSCHLLVAQRPARESGNSRHWQ